MCRGPLTYRGHEAIAADVRSFKQALTTAGLEEGFMTSIAPASCSRIGNEYYADDEEFLYACAEAMRDLVDVLLSIDVRAYSFEAGNVRHEHERKVWQDVALPAGKLILPGVVSHATNVVEHPELVADRIVRFAECVGRENVIASTDCGSGGRVHPQLAWAKLESFAEGAELATQRIWP